jgi:hypothetical protein
MLRKILLVFSILLLFGAAYCRAQSDYIGSMLGWEQYYYHFKIKGYPRYNPAQDRYDFYDLDGCYCGSLCYNPLLEEWEYFAL